MSIIFKLIGINENNITLTIKLTNNNINLKFLQELFVSININKDEIKKIKFITDSEQIKTNKNILIKDGEEKIIFIFTSDLELRNKILVLFNEKKCIQIEDNNLFLTNDIINNINDNSIKLFMDPDFRNLISIYLRKPELFGILAQYIQYEDITIKNNNIQNFNDLNEDEKKNYNTLANQINHLGLNIPYEIIIQKLIQFSGHLNLTVRSILCDIAKNNNI
jgi:hypothetical protein